MNKGKAILVLLALNLVLMLYFGITLGRKIEANRIQTLSEVAGLNNQLLMMNDSIASRVNEALNAQADRIEQAEYRIVDVDSEADTARVDLTVSLKEAASGSQIYLSYYSSEQKEPQTAELSLKEGLLYGAEIGLSPGHNYYYDVWEESGSGKRKLNVNERPLPLYDDLYTGRVQFEGGGTSSSDERLEANFAFTVRDLGWEAAQLDQAVIEVLLNGRMIDEQDITGRLQVSSAAYGMLEDKYRLMVASGQLEPSVSLEEFAEMQDYLPETTDPANGGDTRYTYKHRIEFGQDYPDMKLDMDSARDLSLKLKLIFKDGFILEY